MLTWRPFDKVRHKRTLSKSSVSNTRLKPQRVMASLASHFRSKRNLPSATSATESRAQPELPPEASTIQSDATELSVFRFDFAVDTNAVGGNANPTTNKKKKKKKKKKKVATAARGDGSEVGSSQSAVMQEPRELSSQSKHTRVSSKATTSSEALSRKATSSMRSIASSAFPPQSNPNAATFLKLRKPTSSDSEVKKMQLRYGQGRRNLVAIAQREKQKQLQQPETSGSNPASVFQFNFGTS